MRYGSDHDRITCDRKIFYTLDPITSAEHSNVEACTFTITCEANPGTTVETADTCAITPGTDNNTFADTHQPGTEHRHVDLDASVDVVDVGFTEQRQVRTEGGQAMSGEKMIRAPERPDLDGLLREAKAVFDRMTPEEQERMLREQRENWVNAELELSRRERGTTRMKVDSRHQKFKVGDWVRKTKGYRFHGVVISAYLKWNDELTGIADPVEWRYDCQNLDGVIHIFSGGQLERSEPDRPGTTRSP